MPASNGITRGEREAQEMLVSSRFRIFQSIVDFRPLPALRPPSYVVSVIGAFEVYRKEFYRSFGSQTVSTSRLAVVEDVCTPLKRQTAGWAWEDACAVLDVERGPKRQRTSAVQDLAEIWTNARDFAE
jgi:hypothetical protein